MSLREAAALACDALKPLADGYEMRAAFTADGFPPANPQGHTRMVIPNSDFKRAHEALASLRSALAADAGGREDFNLAMAVLQSELYGQRADVREGVDAILAKYRPEPESEGGGK